MYKSFVFISKRVKYKMSIFGSFDLFGRIDYHETCTLNWKIMPVMQGREREESNTRSATLCDWHARRLIERPTSFTNRKNGTNGSGSQPARMAVRAGTRRSER